MLCACRSGGNCTLCLYRVSDFPQEKVDAYRFVGFETTTVAMFAAKKIGEEAGEVIIAAKNDSKTELLNESADLLFHLMLVLKSKDYSIQDVVDVLESRHNG